MSPITPVFAPTPVRPRSQWGKGGGSAVYRDQLRTSTWFLLGAAVFSALFFVTRSAYVFLPIYLLMGMRVTEAALMAQGWIRNTFMDGVIMGKVSAQLPPVDGDGGMPSSRGVCVFIIGARSNHPMGLLAPGFKETGEWFTNCVKDLEEHAAEYDFLGMSSWLGSERKTGNELTGICYFSTTAGLHKFALGPVHRKAWEGYVTLQKTYPHLGIMHETYDVPAGNWETIYVNSHKTGLGASSMPMVTEEGETVWWQTLIDASRGKFRTSRGRMNRSEGTENEKHGFTEQYAPAVAP